MMSFLPLSKLRSRAASERGLTLPELLVAMGLLVLVAGVSLAILLSTVASSNRFGQNTANQTEVANAIGVINRDIVSASSANYASSTAITLMSTEDSVDYQVKIFGYDPREPDRALPSDFTVNTTSLPNYPAIIEQRQRLGASTVTQNVLVPGWSAANQSTSLFTYYDQSDSQLQPSAGGASLTNPGDIVRVEFFIAAKVSDRTSNIELAGSATIHSLGVTGVRGGNNPFPTKPNAPVLTGILYERETTAYLSWQAVAGATGYTLSRSDNGGPSGVLKIFGDPDTLKFNDPDRELGHTYTYTLTALGSGTTPSDPSTGVDLTVVPPKVTIVNVNTRAGLNDVAPNVSAGTTSNLTNGQTYTVARDLVNQITWAPVTGATGYYVFRDNDPMPLGGKGVSANIHSIRDSNVTYGDTHSYRVQAFNQGSNCIGTRDGLLTAPAQICDGFPSDSTSLISPPTAPTINAVNNGETNSGNTPTNTVSVSTKSNDKIGGANVTGYALYAVSTTGSAANCAGLNDNDTGVRFSASTNDSVGWGTSTCYGAKGYNDAGYSLMSNTPTVDQGPSNFQIVNVNPRIGSFGVTASNGYPYTTAIDRTNQIAWNVSQGADGYRIFRDGNWVQNLPADQHSWQDNADYGQARTYYVQSFSVLDNSSYNDNSYAKQREQSQNTASVTLTSAPTAPTISAVANDDSTASKSLNYVYVNDPGQRTANVTVYRSQLAGASPTCSTSTALTTNAGGTNSDNNADWGSSSCYVAQAFNDAGASPLSNKVTAAQLPSRFGITRASNDQHYMGSYVEGFGASRNGSGGNRVQTLQYTLGWEQSLGSAKYDVIAGYKNDNPNTTNRIDWSGNGYGTCNDNNINIMNSMMPSNTVDNTRCFIGDSNNSTSQTFSTSDLTPGSFYQSVIIAVGNNGLRRGASTNFVTTATAPKFASVYSYKRQVDNASKGGTAYMARVANVGIQTSIGGATSVRAFNGWNDNPTSVSYGNSSPTWYSRTTAQGTNEYLRVRTSGLSATQDTAVKNTSLCRQVTDNWCHVFNTDYDSNGTPKTSINMTQTYNSDWASRTTSNPPTHYQFGNFDVAYANGGAQSNLSSNTYNYSGYSDMLEWYSGISQSNCYYRACNPNDTNVTAGTASGPWAGYSYNEYVPNGLPNHAYYYMAPSQGEDPDGRQGSPPSEATRTYATGSASTSDGSLPDNNVASND